MNIQYLAGAIDGGYIGINKRIRKDRKSPEYQLNIVVSSKEFSYLEALRGHTKGLGRIYLNRHANGNYAAGWQWRIADRQADHLLEKVYPWLIKKKMQADSALEFRALIGQRGNHEEREKYFQTIKKMNR